MAKLAPEQRNLTRAVIAGIFAWLLALQGFAAAASAPMRFAQPAAGQAISQSGEYCGTRGGGDPAAPCQQDHCDCCIRCTPNLDSSGLAGAATILAVFLAFPGPRVAAVAAWRFSGGGNKPPSGWTSSWSQRAPPRLS